MEGLWFVIGFNALRACDRVMSVVFSRVSVVCVEECLVVP